MCGRFALTAKTGDIENLMPEVKVTIDLKPRYNVAPSQNIAAVLNSKPHEISLVKWGLIPSWAKDSSIGNKMINARAEGINEKPSFKYPFRKKRCLIFADSFYEWKPIPGDKRKQPYLIKMKSGKPFMFAGLWDSWNDNENGLINSSTIITTEPNELMSAIHNRMPVILSKEYYKLWLSNEASTETLLNLLKPYESEEMEAYPISLKINNPAYDDEDCQQLIG